MVKEFCVETNFQCPVCLNPLFPPIMMCNRGHSFCPKCTEKLEKCALCRGHFDSTRNLLAESIYKVVEVPCKNKDDGCQFKALGKDMLQHHKECRVGLVECPRRGMGCQWLGELTMLTRHVLDEHF